MEWLSYSPLASPSPFMVNLNFGQSMNPASNIFIE